MKTKLLLIVSFLLTTIAYGQRRPGGEEKIQALKIAFITQKLSLTSSEAQKFWPVYNEYDEEVKKIKTEHQGPVIDRDEKILNLRKKYSLQFEKIIGSERTNKLYVVEAEFREVLIKQLRNRGRGR